MPSRITTSRDTTTKSMMILETDGRQSATLNQYYKALRMNRLIRSVRKQCSFTHPKCWTLARQVDQTRLHNLTFQ
jgi:hypothetical protein